MGVVRALVSEAALMAAERVARAPAQAAMRVVPDCLVAGLERTFFHGVCCIAGVLVTTPVTLPLLALSYALDPKGWKHVAVRK